MTDSLEQVASEVAVCTKCPLHQGRERAVPGEGPSDAKLMFIGEGPGFHEDQSGRPFVGAAGKFLEELLAAIGLSREDVFIANVVKCRPPENRVPKASEAKTCLPFLRHQIALVKPRVIVPLCATALRYLLPHRKGEAKRDLVGRPFTDLEWPGITFLVFYHPAYLLRDPRKQPEARQHIAVLASLERRP